jgi:RNA polymerase sigma-70 factor (ECF subfamily)
VSELDRVFRREWAHLLATLIRYTGSPELAEDALQEAFARASASRDRALLINPAAWITTVAKRIAVDTVRRDAALARRLPLLAHDQPVPAQTSVIDDRLELVLLACSPSLTPDQRIALSLRFVFGVGTAAIADAMLVQHTAMSARLTRAKRRIERDGIASADLARVDDALAVIHVLYTIGHTLPQGNELADRDVATTAVELARAVRGLHPTEPETAGLLALLLLTEARAPGRMDGDGVVTVEAADRTRWDRAAIAEGISLATVALPGGGRFALEAGISGLHSSARTWQDTDWDAIALLYDRLVERWPSPSAQVARVVARSYRRGGLLPALAELDALDNLPGAAARQHLAARADILRRLQRREEARAAYVRARSAEPNGTVRAWFDRRIGELD